MTTKEVMKKYKRSRYTLKIWRRGYYTQTYKGKTEKVYLLPDKSGIPCEWVQCKNGKKCWSYNPVKVAVWVKKLEDYRSNRGKK